MKIGIITSNGGHFVAMYQLKELFDTYPHFWVTYKGQDTRVFLKNETKYYSPNTQVRNPLFIIKGLFLAYKILRKEKPTILISSGAGIAFPYFIAGRLLNIKLIFIETYDFIKYPSSTGKILYNIADLFLVQHTSQKKWFPKAKYWGALL